VQQFFSTRHLLPVEQGKRVRWVDTCPIPPSSLGVVTRARRKFAECLGRPSATTRLARARPDDVCRKVLRRGAVFDPACPLGERRPLIRAPEFGWDADLVGTYGTVVEGIDRGSPQRLGAAFGRKHRPATQQLLGPRRHLVGHHYVDPLDAERRRAFIAKGRPPLRRGSVGSRS
jgi:hypothetical protein